MTTTPSDNTATTWRDLVGVRRLVTCDMRAIPLPGVWGLRSAHRLQIRVSHQSHTMPLHGIRYGGRHRRPDARDDGLRNDGAREDGFPLTSNDFRECLAGRPDWPEPKSPSRKPFTKHSQGDVPQNYEQRG